MNFVKINIIIFSLILVTFTSCSSSDNSKTNINNEAAEEVINKESDEKTVIFVDDIVVGIEYRNNGKIRFTNEKGEFKYIVGQDTKFYIGNILIGNVNNIPSDNFLFIQDILNIDRSSTKNDKLLQIAGFLQALDSNKSTSKIELKKEDIEKFNDINDNILDINLSKVLDNHSFEVIPRYKIVNHLEDVNNKFAFNNDEKNFLSNLFKDEYLWNQEISEQNNSSFTNPNEMINAYKYDKLDKWSYSQTFANYESESTQTTDGFGCYYYYDIIVDVQRGSPCDTSGLQRGDILLYINDKNITEDTYLTAANDLGTPYKFTVNRPLNDTNSTYETLNINVTPNYFHYQVSKRQIFKNLNTDENIGHFIYDSFSALSTIEIYESFKYFKDNNISELIIDLRSNGGGLINAAHYLLSHLKNEHIGSKVFTYKYNALNAHKNYSELFYKVNNSLNLSRVVFLTSQDTASASELVINSLKPYADVVVIGDKTHGKPVGMYGENISNKFMYWLINFSIVNADGQGDFYEGIEPNCYVKENINFQRYNIDDKLLNDALYYITNAQCNTNKEKVNNSQFMELNNYTKKLDDSICYECILKDVKTKNIFYNEDEIIFVSHTTSEIIRYDLKTDKFKDLVKIRTISDQLSIKSTTYSKEYNILYLGYSDGKITKIHFNDDALIEIDFTNLKNSVNGLSIAGDYLLAQDANTTNIAHHIYDKNSSLVETKNSNHYSNYYAWDKNKSRVYFFSDASISKDIFYEEVNQTNGNIVASGNTPSNNGYITQGPIFTSTNGKNILLGNARVINASDLTWNYSLLSTIEDAIWLDDNKFIFAHSSLTQTTLQIANNSIITDTKTFDGVLLKLVKNNNEVLILTVKDNRIQFYKYEIPL